MPNRDQEYQWGTHIRGAAIIQEPQAKMRQLTQQRLCIRKVWKGQKNSTHTRSHR